MVVTSCWVVDTFISLEFDGAKLSGAGEDFVTSKNFEFLLELHLLVVAATFGAKGRPEKLEIGTTVFHLLCDVLYNLDILHRLTGNFGW